MSLVPLTASIYQQITGQRPLFSLKGYASITDGNPRAMGALMMINGRQYIVFDVLPGANKRDIVKGWRILKDQLGPGRYYAVRDDEVETSDALLGRFGFKPIDGNLFLYVK